MRLVSQSAMVMSSVPKNDEMQLTLSDFDKISGAYRTFSPD